MTKSLDNAQCHCLFRKNKQKIKVSAAPLEGQKRDWNKRELNIHGKEGFSKFQLNLIKNCSRFSLLPNKVFSRNENWDLTWRAWCKLKRARVTCGSSTVFPTSNIASSIIQGTISPFYYAIYPEPIRLQSVVSEVTSISISFHQLSTEFLSLIWLDGYFN